MCDETEVEPAQGRPLRRQYVVWLLLAGFVLAIYGQVWGFGFLNFDDDLYVSKNPYVYGGLTARGVWWAFTTTHASNWHPVTWLSHMLDVAMFGTRPGAHHLVNVFFHLVNTLLLFALLKRMTGDLWRSAFVAGLFAAHPLHVESVAWVAERKDVLSAGFGLLTLHAYLSQVRRGGAVRYVLTASVFALSLMSKPMLVSLPAVLVLVDIWPLGRWAVTKPVLPQLVRLTIPKAPLFALAAASCVVTFLAQRSGGSVTATQVLPVSLRLANAAVSYVRYLVRLAWPSGLAFFYPHPGRALPVWQVLVSALVLLAITGCALIVARRRPYLFMGWFWYLGMLVPVIGLVQVGAQALADRYTYLPLVGVFIMLAWGIPDLAARVRVPKAALAVAAVLVLAALAARATVQVGYWRDSATLAEHALRVTKDNYVAHCSLGEALYAAGKDEDAVDHYRRALAVYPDYPVAHNNLGCALTREGRPNEAVKEFEAALRVDPKYTKAMANLGKALGDLGRHDEAVAQYQRALRIAPDFLQAHDNLGSELARRGDFTGAFEHYETVLRIDPGNTQTLANYGKALEDAGRPEEAAAYYRRALTADPEYVPAHDNLGLLLTRQGKPGEAEAHFEIALKSDPHDLQALLGLGRALDGMGRFEEARRYYARAVDARPDSALAHDHLAFELERLGAVDEAIRHYEAATRADPQYTPGLNNLGNLLWRLGRTQEAVEKYQAAMTANPKDESAYCNLGSAAASQGRFDEALDYYMKAYERKPGDPVIMSNIAAVLQHRGRLAEAEEWLRKWLALSPGSTPAHIRLADLLAAEGKEDEARKHYVRALEIAPRDAEAHCGLGEVLARQGKTTEALSHFDEALAADPGHPRALTGREALKRETGTPAPADQR